MHPPAPVTNRHTPRVTRFARESSEPAPWALGLFAHNEAANVRAAIDSLAAARSGQRLDVFVLVNGCRDRTAEVVRAAAPGTPGLTLVEIDLADKANAWNVFVHDVLAAEPPRSVVFFMDADVTAGRRALSQLVEAFDEVPSAKAAGALPANGRDRDPWRQRMVEHGTLAGNLYALRGSFVQRIQALGLRMPMELIGEDFFVSWLVGTELGRRQRQEDGPQCVFHGEAQFSFRSLSRFRLADYRTYARRTWRYTRRALQHQMLTALLEDRGLGAMPRTIDELYRVGPLPSRLAWVGLDTPLRLLAVLQIRAARRRRNRRMLEGTTS